MSHAEYFAKAVDRWTIVRLRLLPSFTAVQLSARRPSQPVDLLQAEKVQLRSQKLLKSFTSQNNVVKICRFARNCATLLFLLSLQVSVCSETHPVDKPIYEKKTGFTDFVYLSNMKKRILIDLPRLDCTVNRRED